MKIIILFFVTYNFTFVLTIFLSYIILIINFELGTYRLKLTYDKLIQFDLVEEYEESFFNQEDRSTVLDYLYTLRDIESTDQFIKESPSFPGSRSGT